MVSPSFSVSTAGATCCVKPSIACGNRLIRRYDDWRDVGRGIMIAFSERGEDPEDEETQTITVSSVRVGERYFPASTFVPPAQSKDYTILGGAQSTTVPYEDDGGARIYLPVLVNGKGPYAFEIDTGGHLIIGAELAKALELEPIGQFAGTGAGTAITQAGVVANQEIRIGEVVDAGEAKTIADLIDSYQLPPQSILVE